MNLNQIVAIQSAIYAPYNIYTTWLKLEVAQNKAVPLMWKNKFTIDVKNGDKTLEKFLKKFIKDNKFIQHAHEIEQICSMWGVCIATINLTKSGELKIVLADPAYTNNVGFQFDEEIGAVIYKKITHSNFSYVIKELWDSEKVQRTFLVNDKSVQIDAINVQIPEELQLPEVEYHNLGFVPVVLFRNKAQYSLYGNNGAVNVWSNQMDDYGCYALQPELEEVWRSASMENKNNRTRVFGNFTPYDLDLYQQNTEKNPFTQTEIMKNSQAGGNSAPGAQNPLIEVTQGNPAFDKYDAHIEYLISRYHKGCGYNYNVDTATTGNGGGESDTATQVGFDNTMDANTTLKKKAIRQDDMNRLFRKIIAVFGIGYDYNELNDEVFEFVINDAITANLPPMVAIQYQKQKMELGIASPVTHLMEMKGMTREEAEKELKVINKDLNTFMNPEQEEEQGSKEDNNEKE